MCVINYENIINVPANMKMISFRLFVSNVSWHHFIIELVYLIINSLFVEVGTTSITDTQIVA